MLKWRYAYAPMMSEQLITVLNGRYAYAPMLSGHLLTVQNVSYAEMNLISASCFIYMCLRLTVLI